MPRRVSTKGGLVGPAGTPRPAIPPDLSLSPQRMAQIERQLRTILYRWRPVTEDPENLMRDLWRLVEDVLDGDPLACPILRDPEAGPVEVIR